MNAMQRTSRTRSYWLRHAPEAAGLRLDSAGWAETEAVLAALDRAGLPGTLLDLERVVAESDKGRFEFSPSGERIRARQGHSITVDAGWQVARPPELLYRGTVQRFLPSILASGLVPKARHHVHLSPDIDTARAVGARRGRSRDPGDRRPRPGRGRNRIPPVEQRRLADEPCAAYASAPVLDGGRWHERGSGAGEARGRERTFRTFSTRHGIGRISRQQRRHVLLPGEHADDLQWRRLPVDDGVALGGRPEKHG